MTQLIGRADPVVVERDQGNVPLALFVAAYIVRELDVRHIACGPASVLYQGHSLWHVLTAASLGASYRFLERASAAR